MHFEWVQLNLGTEEIYVEIWTPCMPDTPESEKEQIALNILRRVIEVKP